MYKVTKSNIADDVFMFCSNKQKPNHAMVVVGWEVFRNRDYFILKNSWSEAWADEGFVRVRASNNTCGMLGMASYPRLRYQDVLRLPTTPASPSP